jgi:hypothetical protein
LKASLLIAEHGLYRTEENVYVLSHGSVARPDAAEDHFPIEILSVDEKISRTVETTWIQWFLSPGLLSRPGDFCLGVLMLSGWEASRFGA